MTELAAQIFIGCVGFLAIGLLWFEVIRPMLASYGIIQDAPHADHYVAPPVEHGSFPNAGTPDGKAENGAGNAPEPRTGNGVPNRIDLLARALATLDDDGVLEVLTTIRNPDGSWRYAESRIGKFAPGRLEDRIEQVRRIRGTDPAPKPPPGPQFEQVGPNSFRRVEGT
jgi:hypothetical protein